MKNPAGPHGGDLPNIMVGPDGKAKVEAVAKLVTLKEGEKNSLFQAGGTSLVIHAGADDDIDRSRRQRRGPHRLWGNHQGRGHDDLEGRTESAPSLWPNLGVLAEDWPDYLSCGSILMIRPKKVR